MKLFISRGHDEHQDFMRRIARDLTEHSCWIDSERIHEQPDWRRSLMDVLLHNCECPHVGDSLIDESGCLSSRSRESSLKP